MSKGNWQPMASSIRTPREPSSCWRGAAATATTAGVRNVMGQCSKWISRVGFRCVVDVAAAHLNMFEGANPIISYDTQCICDAISIWA